MPRFYMVTNRVSSEDGLGSAHGDVSYFASVSDDKKACRAKISIIAHSMGNYVLQEAMNVAWERQNKPLLVSLVNQLVMVAADVDNDLFKTGEKVGNADGEGIANLTYRISAL